MGKRKVASGLWTLVALVGVAVVAYAGCERAAMTPQEEQVIPEEQSSRFSRTFTTGRDFDEGQADGVSSDQEGQLQMTLNQSLFSTPYLWVPNSSENTISKLDTMTLELLGTYPLVDAEGETCYNPSRTTVDRDWDVWVGCRGTASYCNRGECSPQTQPQVDNKVMKISFEDGSVLLSVRVGNAPRALALDARDHLWIGNSVDDTIWEIDGETGACYRGEGPSCPGPAIEVPDFPYGAVVDQDGALWIVNNKLGEDDPDQVTKIDTDSGAIMGVYGPFLRGGCDDLYGIAIDQLGAVWLGGYGCDDVVKLDGESGDFIGAYLIGGERTRGLAVDLDGNVWAASSQSDTVTKVNGATGEIITTRGVGQQPIGVAVDTYGHVWVVNREADSVTKINGIDYTSEDITVGHGPYTYSDMLGLALRTITLRSEAVATWRGQVDSGHDQARFTAIEWTAEVPPDTLLTFRYRCATTQEALSGAPFSPDLPAPGPVECGEVAQRWLEVEARFSATGTSASPVIYDLSVAWEVP